MGVEISSPDFQVGIQLGETFMSHHDELTEEPRKMMKTSVTPFVLTFNNLTYSLNTSKELSFSSIFCRKQTELPSTSSSKKKMLLHDISGEAREGEILAILGPSGSGKSTLIDALANRISKESLKGSVTMNGETLESGVLKTISAYVMQDDLLYPMLTVEETLMFSAEFRLPRTLSKSKKLARVQDVIDELGLHDAAKTIIGDEGERGISGGERRRVSIGVDIIHDPILFFLDEPTSGLDSSCAFMVVKVLQRIARTGRIVIMSVHQPSSRVVGLLDQLIFLSHGETVYYGSSTNLSLFLSDFGHPIPENDEKTEFMLDLYRELEGVPGGRTSIVNFNTTWKKLQSHNYHPESFNELSLAFEEAASARISRRKLIYSDADDTGPALADSKFVNPFWVEIFVLVKRSLSNSKRKPELILHQIGAVAVVSSVLASLFWNLDKTEVGVQERVGFFAFMVTTIFFGSIEVLAVFVQDRYIFMRETAYNAYRRSSYNIYRSILVIPRLLILAILFASITLWSVGLNGGFPGFLFYFLSIFVSLWAGDSFVSLISGLVSQVILGYIVVVPLIGVFLLFSGFFIHRDRIPTYWIWFHYISVVKYPFQAMLLSEFDNANLCLVEGVIQQNKSCLLVGKAEQFVNPVTQTSSALGSWNLPTRRRKQKFSDSSQGQYAFVFVCLHFLGTSLGKKKCFVHLL
ncbi:ABC transporter G family member 1-like [Papaver somniferum]|uniref:ABC transporter G family member 1-like n=1 Tax=Papaver somniferum TaxID=3469 RepID=UPI000E6FEE54|nr:ABC transporter G family member 1-like [Papaver somniferum]